MVEIGQAKAGQGYWMIWTRQVALPVLFATLWISLSEFFRNEWMLKSAWADHYAAMGLDFPSAPINGMLWGLWSLLFAIGIRIILTQFDLLRGAALAWLMGFVLMWVVTGNMAVLPLGILIFAVPLSLLEVFVAAWIIRALSERA